MTEDYLDILFTKDPEVIAANIAEANRIEKAESDFLIENAERVASNEANRCPKCMGEGRLSQFAHRNGGVCFTCGGTGVFTRYAV